jgi:hypothetical protein
MMFTHPLSSGPDHLSADAKDSPAAVGTDSMNVKSGRPAVDRRASRKNNSAKGKTPHGVASDGHS